MGKKSILKLLSILVAPFFLYFLAVLIGLFVSTETKFKGEKKYTVYIATGDIHVDFILPFKTDILQWNNFINLREYKKLKFFPKYIQLGWGERAFYLDMIYLKNLTIEMALKAALFPTPTLMHVTLYSGLPKNIYRLKEVKLTQEQYEILVSYIKSSFKYNEDKIISVPDRGYYNYYDMKDNFYEGTGSYHLFNTCNMWTVEGMRKAGLKSSIFSPFKYGVDRFLD